MWVARSWLIRLPHPPTTARWRLTLLYGGLFLVCGAALLTVTYLLVSHHITGGQGVVIPPSSGGGKSGWNTPNGLPPPTLKMPTVPRSVLRILESSPGREFLRLAETQQRVDELHRLEIESAIALGIMAILSGLLGWFVAGRVLAPAEAAFESQRRFVTNASHELRTPLTTMRAVLDVAIAKPDVAPQVTALDAKLREDLDDADRLLASFLVLARAQRGALGEQRLVSLAEIVDDALAGHGEAIAAKQIDLHSALTPACVQGSETLLARMVDNLIDNAVRHNIPCGLINVRCGSDRESARLVVESGTNTVRVTIGRLRRRLGEPQVIQTSPGIGYWIG